MITLHLNIQYYYSKKILNSETPKRIDIGYNLIFRITRIELEKRIIIVYFRN